VSTGISGLDAVLGGGFPMGHIYLIEGESGAGKSTLGMQFLLEGQGRGERGLWITMSETERELEQAARSHGWRLDGIEILNLVVPRDALRSEEDYSFFSPADVELDETIRAILAAVERVQPSRVVFDPFSDIKHLARDVLRYRRQILALRDFFSERGCTVLLMQEMTRGSSGDVQAEALTHGYLTLQQESPEYGGQRRRLRVHKMRGIDFRDGYHDFSIETGGVFVYPRLIAAEHYEELGEGAVSSGISELDQLLGGGLDLGSSVLIMGPTGVGKSTLATQYALEAAERGDKASCFLFDETVRTFKVRTEKLGMPISKPLAEGRLRLRQIDPAEFSTGEFAHLVVQEVEKSNVRIVVIDSLSGYLSAMPEERFLSTHVHELLTYLSHRNVVTILTLAQHGVVGEHVESPVDISYLADTVLMIRYFEAFGDVRRALSVIKKRSGAHESRIREMLIGPPQGVRIGAPLREFQGVLTGRPVYTGEAADLRKG
jgi:circadian clock protein KaiC